MGCNGVFIRMIGAGGAAEAVGTLRVGDRIWKVIVFRNLFSELFHRIIFTTQVINLSAKFCLNLFEAVSERNGYDCNPMVTTVIQEIQHTTVQRVENWDDTIIDIEILKNRTIKTSTRG